MPIRIFDRFRPSTEEPPPTPYQILRQMFGPDETTWPAWIVGPTAQDIAIKDLGELDSNKHPKHEP